ncbi:MAG: GAF and ANTAR domain-containing protein [Mycobacterium sp.]|nr:GAF and ANTAR domain-containing protein [Mycobacterium sp.]
MTRRHQNVGSPSKTPAQAESDDTLSVERAHIFRILDEVDHRRDGTDFESALREINAIAAASVPGAKYVGITVVDHSGAVSTLAATHHYPSRLDDVERGVQEGPCLWAARNADAVLVPDLATESRWPRYRHAALRATPVRSIMSFRLSPEDKTQASLNFYTDIARAFDGDTAHLGALFAAHTSLAWKAIRRQEQFRSALASRDVIGQAKGVLMERFGIDADAAFELLRRVSQDCNTKVIDVAARVAAKVISAHVSENRRPRPVSASWPAPRA